MGSAPQRAGSWTFGAIFENILGRIRDGKKVRTVKGESELLELKAESIPEDITVSVVIDVDMPQDKLQNANVASMVVDRGLASKEWARESLLNINSPGEMEKDIVKEQITNMLLQECHRQHGRMVTQGHAADGTTTANGFNNRWLNSKLKWGAWVVRWAVCLWTTRAYARS